ncbi:hypothetical protein Tco_0946484 [Tanacetum coccineum]
MRVQGHAGKTNVITAENISALKGKRYEKNYSSMRKYVADPVNAYPKRSITNLILKGAVIFDVVSYQFRYVREIFMQQFWYTIKKVQGTDSYELLLANKKCVVNADISSNIIKSYEDPGDFPEHPCDISFEVDPHRFEGPSGELDGPPTLSNGRDTTKTV